MNTSRFEMSVCMSVCLYVTEVGVQGWKCQGSPAFPRCRAQHGKPHPSTGSVVVLTTAHLDHNPANNDLSNLRAWCQRCHNTYDAPRRRINAKFTQERIAAERALRGLA